MPTAPIRWSRRLYRYMESDGGAIPWGALLVGLLAAGAGAGSGYLVAAVLDDDRDLGAYIGVMLALGIEVLCLLLATAIVLVARLLNVEEEQPRPVGRRGWR